MRYIIKITFFLQLLFVSVYSQLNLGWESSFSVNNGRTGVESMSLDSAGNIITAGFFYGGTIGNGIIVTKYSPEGLLIWAKQENTTADAYVKSAVDSEGNVFIGTSDYSDWIIYKYDQKGGKLWEKRFKYWIYGLNNLKALAMDNEGCLYATGYMQDSAWLSFGYYDYNLCLIKYMPAGNIEWVSYFDDGDNAEIGNDICIGNNGDIAVCGRTFYNGDPNSNFLTLLYDTSGKLKWARKFGTMNYSMDVTYNVRFDGNNNVIVAGVVDTQLCVVKYDNNGNYLWSSLYDGYTYSYSAADIKLNVDNLNDIIISAPIWIPYGIYTPTSILTVKYDLNGNMLWENTMSINDWSAYPKGMMIDKFANILVCGELWNNLLIGNGKVLTHKYNRNGVILWYEQYGNESYGMSTGNSLLDKNSNIYIGGRKRHIDSSDIADDLFVLKYKQRNPSEIPMHFSLSQNYPNPFNPVTKIKFTVPEAGIVEIKIFDVTGKLVGNPVNSFFNSGEYETDFSGAKLASGVYFYTAEFGGYSETKKMILVK